MFSHQNVLCYNSVTDLKLVPSVGLKILKRKYFFSFTNTAAYAL